MRFLIAATAVFAACSGASSVQCQQDVNCDLAAGGRCVVAATGHQWCAYPDPTCSAGYRYSDFEIGDDVSGQCFIPQSMASCAGLPRTCGVTGNDSCCYSPEVPGGTYYRSYGSDGDGDKNSPATVSTFHLDKYEVTVGRFRAFVATSQGTLGNPPAGGSGGHPNIPESGWQASWTMELPLDTAALLTQLKCGLQDGQPTSYTWTDTPGPNENRPINCVSWAEAMAFCAWDGGFLPTEAEWNYAAAGGPQQRPYPWSSSVPGPLILDNSYASYAVRDGSTGAVQCLGDNMPACDLADLLEVGHKPRGDGRWGQSDLAGNIAEWTLDTQADYVNSCTDCTNLTYGDMVINRGGDFFSLGSTELRTGHRGFGSRGAVEVFFGVRCARAAPEQQGPARGTHGRTRT